MWASAGVLALPSEDDLQATVYFADLQQWVVESADATVAVDDGAILEVGDQVWRLDLPVAVVPTVASSDPLVLDDLQLQFEVSADEEHVAIRAEDRGRTLDLGARSHHYLLLTLARLRLEEEALAPAERGWIHLTDLERMLNLSELQLNLQIFRARRQLAEAGVADGARIVQRRQRTGLVRLGASRIVIGSRAGARAG